MNIRIKKQYNNNVSVSDNPVRYYTLQYYAIKTGKNIEFNDGRSSILVSPLNLDENTITIHNCNIPEIGTWKYHKLNIIALSKKDFSVRCDSRVLEKPYPKIQEITDERGEKIAYVVYNNIFIPFKMQNSYILEYILEKATLLLDFNTVEVKELQMELQRKKYCTFLTKGIEEKKNNLQQTIQQSRARINDISNTLQIESTNLYNKIEELDLWNNYPLKSLEEKALKDFDRMKTMITSKMFSYIKFETNECIAETNNCYVMYKKKKYLVGKFIININSNTGSVTISSLNSNYIKYNYIHPHISGTNICYGNISKTVSALSAKREYLTLLQLLHRYLNSYNHSDAYAKFGTNRWSWKEVKEKL